MTHTAPGQNLIFSTTRFYPGWVLYFLILTSVTYFYLSQMLILQIMMITIHLIQSEKELMNVLHDLGLHITNSTRTSKKLNQRSG